MASLRFVFFCLFVLLFVVFFLSRNFTELFIRPVSVNCEIKIHFLASIFSAFAYKLVILSCTSFHFVRLNQFIAQ